MQSEQRVKYPRLLPLYIHLNGYSIDPAILQLHIGPIEHLKGNDCCRYGKSDCVMIKFCSIYVCMYVCR